MKQNISIWLTILVSMVGIKVFASDIEVKNEDGITIGYNYFNDGKELEVVGAEYNETLVIPEEVTYMNRTRKVTSIRDYAFAYYGPKKVVLPNSIIYIQDGAFCMSGVLSINLPENLEYIGAMALQECDFSSITIPNSVKTIGERAFRCCQNLKTVSMGSGVKEIKLDAFLDCNNLEKVIISDISAWCNIEFENYNSNPAILSHHIYSDENNEITELYIPNGVTSINKMAFYGCSSLTSVYLPNSVTTIAQEAFYGCNGLTSITLPNSVTSIGNKAFDEVNLNSIVSLIEYPNKITSKDGYYYYEGSFSLNTFNNATLYVPKGTVDKYKTTEGWKDFLFIEEGTGDNPPSTQKCSTPTISYHYGKLTFNSDTEGVIFHSTVTDDDIKSYDGNEIQLGVSYNISVYATKEGYQNSEIATATLCWIDVEPKTEGITDGMAQMPARAVMVKAEGGQLIIEGADDNTNISVYNIDGVQLGTSTSRNGVALINTSIPKSSVTIVKIGNKSVKVMMK